jgi:predicted amidohydrolase
VSTDLILHNAKIATNGMPSQVGAIAVSDGKISASGTNGEILRLRGPATTAIDVKGRTVIPGLNDSHMHPISSIFIPTSNFPLRITCCYPPVGSFSRGKASKTGCTLFRDSLLRLQMGASHDTLETALARSCVGKRISICGFQADYGIFFAGPFLVPTSITGRYGPDTSSECVTIALGSQGT